ncbi:MAG: hypothetical protein DME86_05680 [Verrucomicrobia bacterium]|nr:MAG: hypothetical protein DME86_05680 [Verrucomicrobiota bacterium]
MSRLCKDASSADLVKMSGSLGRAFADGAQTRNNNTAVIQRVAKLERTARQRDMIEEDVSAPSFWQSLCSVIRLTSQNFHPEALHA